MENIFSEKELEGLIGNTETRTGQEPHSQGVTGWRGDKKNIDRIRPKFIFPCVSSLREDKVRGGEEKE